MFRGTQIDGSVCSQGTSNSVLAPLCKAKRKAKAWRMGRSKKFTSTTTGLCVCVGGGEVQEGDPRHLSGRESVSLFLTF